MRERALGGRERQDVGGAVLVSKAGVELVNNLVSGEQDDQVALGRPDGGLGRAFGDDGSIRQGVDPGLVLDLDLDLASESSRSGPGWLRAASAS